MSSYEQMRDRIRTTINMRTKIDPAVVEDMIDEIMLGAAVIIDELEVPIPIEEENQKRTLCCDWTGHRRLV